MVIASIGYLSLFLDAIPSFLSKTLPALVSQGGSSAHQHVKREAELSQKLTIIYGVLIPVLVLLSGIFAGLTLGYMSLDETQLNVLSISGTPYVTSARRPYTLTFATVSRGNMLRRSSRSGKTGIYYSLPCCCAT